MQIKLNYYVLLDFRISFLLERCSLPANKDELIDYAIRTGAPAEVIENLQALEDGGIEIYDSIEDIWPDYPSEEDFLWNEEEY